MAKDKKSFIAYCDWQETFEALPDETAGKLIKHIFKYVNDQEPKCDDVLINAVFANIKQSLKRDLKKYEDTLKQKRDGGAIGNLKRWHPDLYQKYANKELSLDECKAIAHSRSLSDTDRSPSDTDKSAKDTEPVQSLPIGVIADSDSVSESVNDSESDIKEINTPKGDVPKAIVFFFKKELKALGVENQLADDWIKVRKLKKAANTKTAFDALVKEFDKSGLKPNECVKMAVENSWSGFKALWLKNQSNNNNQQQVSLQNPNKLWDSRKK